MARLARIAVSGIPYHVTQRGNRRQRVFFREEDYQVYLALLRQQCQRWGLQIWAYCLMTNHVHLIAYPEAAESLTRAVAETHRRYTRHVNFREGWRGYLWQGRFASFPLDEPHLLAALRYVEHNPVAAGLVQHAEDYPWSSAQAHVTRMSDAMLSPHPLQATIPDWSAFLATATQETENAAFERHSRTGRPFGDDAFVTTMEHKTGRALRRHKPGPKRKDK
jgi:putative transposase